MKATLTLFLFVLIMTGRAIFSQTVTMGTQVWMTKNLDVSTFRNGDPIPEAKTQEEWTKAGQNKQPAWCYYDNDPANGDKYGKLYNWYAVNDPRGLAPVGYHIPSIAELKKLEDYFERNPIYETKYVEVGGYYEKKWVSCNNCSYWTEKQKANNPCPACRNERGKLINTGKYIPKTKQKRENELVSLWIDERGFSGLRGGYRAYYDLISVGYAGYWWCSSEFSTWSAAWSLEISRSNGDVFWDGYSQTHGMSVRCLRD